MNKSQVSFEFIFAIGIVVLIFTFFFILMMNKSNDISKIGGVINKDKECLRMSNIISNVYKNGPGTQINTKTNYVMTIFNNSLIDIQDIQNVSYVQNRIAILVSEAGTSTKEFYDIANAKFHPDFYKVCFTSLIDQNPAGMGGLAAFNYGDCSHNDHSVTVDWRLIPKNLSDLIANIDDYQTIYLEDPHLHPGQVYTGAGRYNNMKYIDILSNWTAEGHVLITSEHFYCRNNDRSNSYPYTDHRCKISESYNGYENWGFFGNNITEGNNDGRKIIIVNKTSPYDFDINTQFTGEEQSNISTINVSGTQVIAKYLLSPYAPAIAFWNYGSGQVHYITDFQVAEQTDFSNHLSDIVSNAYFLIATPTNKGGGRCNFYGNSPYSVITGNLTIKNINNIINITVNPI